MSNAIPLTSAQMALNLATTATSGPSSLLNKVNTAAGARPTWKCTSTASVANPASNEPSDGYDLSTECHDTSGASPLASSILSGWTGERTDQMGGNTVHTASRFDSDSNTYYQDTSARRDEADPSEYGGQGFTSATAVGSAKTGIHTTVEGAD
jgi:hypothetical protein